MPLNELNQHQLNDLFFTLQKLSDEINRINTTINKINSLIHEALIEQEKTKEAIQESWLACLIDQNSAPESPVFKKPFPVIKK